MSHITQRKENVLLMKARIIEAGEKGISVTRLIAITSLECGVCEKTATEYLNVLRNSFEVIVKEGSCRINENKGWEK